MLPPSAEAGHVVFARRKFPSANISNNYHAVYRLDHAPHRLEDVQMALLAHCFRGHRSEHNLHVRSHFLVLVDTNPVSKFTGTAA